MQPAVTAIAGGSEKFVSQVLNHGASIIESRDEFLDKIDESSDLQEVLDSIDFLTLENRWMQEFMTLHGIDDDMLTEELRKNQSKENKSGDFRARAKVKSKIADLQSVLSNDPPTISLGVKVALSEIVVKEYENQLKRAKSLGEGKDSAIKVMGELCEIHICDARSAASDLKRTVICSHNEAKSTTTLFTKWCEDRLRKKENDAEKLYAKNATLKSQIEKLQQVILEKEETGGSLNMIDLDQMKIENQQTLEKIEERNRELLKLKLTSGNIVHTLNITKKMMSVMVEESQQLNKMLQEKNVQKEFFQREVERIEAEKDESKVQIAKMKKAIDESCMPEVRSHFVKRNNFYTFYIMELHTASI
jgi:chromosome segregation ATPase